jgi:hypothetical protein
MLFNLSIKEKFLKLKTNINSTKEFIDSIEEIKEFLKFILDLSHKIGLSLNLWEAQNIFFDIYKTHKEQLNKNVDINDELEPKLKQSLDILANILKIKTFT